MVLEPPAIDTNILDMPVLGWDPEETVWVEDVRRSTQRKDNDPLYDAIAAHMVAKRFPVFDSEESALQIAYYAIECSLGWFVKHFNAGGHRGGAEFTHVAIIDGAGQLLREIELLRRCEDA